MLRVDLRKHEQFDVMGVSSKLFVCCNQQRFGEMTRKFVLEGASLWKKGGLYEGCNVQVDRSIAKPSLTSLNQVFHLKLV